MRYLLGADIGTTSMKIVLADENGEIIAGEGESYEISGKNAFEAELDADTYWKVFKEILNRIIEKHEYIKDSHCVIAIDSQGETLIITDESGRPIRNAIVWLDNRAVNESQSIGERFKEKDIYKITGQPGSVPTWPASKILWLREHEKQNFKKTYKFLMVSDYINYKLTGRYVTDRSIVSSTLYFDINRNIWWDEMLDYLGIHRKNLPEIRSSGDPIGRINERASMETGLGSDTFVYAGALDQMTSSVGAGNTRDDMVTESTGTCLALCVNTLYHDENLLKYRIPCHVHALKDKYCLLFWSQTAGAILEWFRNNFSPDTSFKVLDEQASSICPTTDGLLVLPHFEGIAVPDFNPEATGVFFGLKLKHEKAHLYRAILEAVAYMLREHIEAANTMGIKINEIISIGGGAKSDFWNGIKADVTGKRIRTLENSETAAIGSIIIAGTGAGFFADIADGVKKCVKTKKIFYPDKEKQVVYEKTFRKYKLLYENLKLMYE